MSAINNEKNKNQLKIYNNELDLKFQKFIKNKKIAIVGPASSNDKYGKEIDKFDIVIKFNQLNKSLQNDPNIYGSKCDITYFSKQAENYYLKKINELEPVLHKNLSWVVLKDNINLDYIDKHKINFNKHEDNFVKFRNTQPFDLGSFKGNPLQLQNVLVDLLRFEPAKIKIYHIDLYLRKDYSYYATFDENKFKDYPGFILAKNHDIFSYYIFLQNLWKKDLIKGDRTFEKIMSIGLEKYINLFQKINQNILKKYI
jgi:hypothetical protein